MVKKTTETVYKIKNCYVGEDCIQRIIPYRNSITVVSKNGILYHHNIYSNNIVNSYIEDERRKQFPYSNIPTHYQMRGLTKYNYTNQLLNLEEPYIIISGRNIVESFVIRDNNEVLLVDNLLHGTEITKNVTREELSNMFNPSNADEKLWLMDRFGRIYKNLDSVIPTEDKIAKSAQKKIREQLTSYIEAAEYDSCLYYMDKETLNYLKKCVEDFDVNKISNIPMRNDNNILIVKANSNKIQIQNVSIWFISPDKYKIIVTDYPISTYTLEQIKSLSTQYKEQKEHKINLILNPKIKKSDIEQAQKLLKF